MIHRCSYRIQKKQLSFCYLHSQNLSCWSASFQGICPDYKLILDEIISYLQAPNILLQKEEVPLKNSILIQEYQPSGEGGTCSPPAMLHPLQKRNGHQGAPKWPKVFGKVSTPKFLGVFLSKHSFFEKRLRQGKRRGKKQGGRKEKNDETEEKSQKDQVLTTSKPSNPLLT